MFLCFEQTEQQLSNSEDESEDDLRLLGISRPKGTPSSLKILRSELELNKEDSVDLSKKGRANGRIFRP